MKLQRRRFLSLAAGTTATLPFLSAGLSPAHAATASTPSFLSGKSKMKLGTVTYNLAKDWDVETLIKNCELAGFEGAELRTTHAHKVEVNLSKAERETIKKRFADSKDYMVLAHDVGASGVKVRPNGFPKDVPKEKTLEQIGRSLRELGEFGEGYGVVIRLEVHGEGTSLLPHIRRILDVANHKNVGITWNSNQTDLAGEGFEHNFDLVKDKIFCVHMRDLFLEEYPFRKLLTRLNQIGFAGYCLAEIPDSKDPVRVMKYFRALWLSYQGLL